MLFRIQQCYLESRGKYSLLKEGKERGKEGRQAESELIAGPQMEIISHGYA